MTKIKLIALDMDGTLLNDDGIVSKPTERVIQRALKEDIHVVLSTGRPLEMCISFAHDLKLSSYLITSNGAEIYTVDENLLEQHTMEAEKVEHLWQIGHKKDIHMWLVAADAVFVDGKRPSNFKEHKWLKIGYGNLDEAHKLYVMEELKQLQDIEVTNSSLSNMEVNGGGVNKASAIRSLCERIGITPNNVLAIGDSLNDFQMIKEAGIGVAVENAQDVILDIADHIAPTNNEDGVAKAIQRFALDGK